MKSLHEISKTFFGVNLPNTKLVKKVDKNFDLYSENIYGFINTLNEF